MIAYEEIHGVMWCVAHDGIADECNDGEHCDMSKGEDDACELVAIYKATPDAGATFDPAIVDEIARTAFVTLDKRAAS